MPFRFNSRAVFLTYPQCGLSAAHTLTLLRTKLGEAEGTHYLIGVEAHADGTPHLHVFVERQNKINTVNERYFDLEDVDRVYHPNVTAPRDRQAVVDYVMKEGQVTKWPDDWDPSGPKKRKGKWEEATPAILAGAEQGDILRLLPSFMLANRKKVADAIAFVRSQGLLAGIPGRQEFLSWDLPEDASYYNVPLFRGVWTVLRDNLKNPSYGRRQLYIWGPTGIGKTYFRNLLGQALKIFDVPMGEEFYDDWEDGKFDLSMMEEFKSQKTIQWMNQWLDGSVLNVRQKGAQYVKKQPVPTLILSNFDPTGSLIYPNVQETEAIKAFRRRLVIVEGSATLMRALSSALRLFLMIPEPSPVPSVTLVEELIAGGMLPATAVVTPPPVRLNPLWTMND